ncbi:MAG: ROK family protein [Acidimicrobiia bacterium]
MPGADPPAAVRLGIDVGGTKILGVALPAAEGSGEPVLLAEHEQPTRAGAAVLDAIDEVVGALLEGVRADVGPPELRGIGVGMPGLVSRGGVLRYGPNLPGAGDLDVAAWLAPRRRCPVVVDNDGDCAAWAEVGLGAGRGSDHVVFVGLGTGISCGMVVEGRRVRGVHGFAGEPGHMTIVPGGAGCACGRQGCWEAYASGSALARQAAEAAAAGRLAAAVARAGSAAAVRGEHLSEALRSGDPEAAAVADRFADWVGLGVANLVHLLDPEVVVVGGSVMSEVALWEHRVRRAYRRHVLGGGLRPRTTVAAAHLGRRAGAIGAALLINALQA